MPGSTQPMEMDMDAAKSHRDTMDKDLEKWHTVGAESITVPARTFSCEHWTKDEGKGDVWVSSKISPMGIVRSVDGNETMVLTKVISDAKTHVRGAPMKFDPQMLRHQMRRISRSRERCLRKKSATSGLEYGRSRHGSAKVLSGMREREWMSEIRMAPS